MKPEGESESYHLPDPQFIHINWKMYLLITYYIQKCFPYGSDSKEYTCNTRDEGSIPRSRRSPGEGHGNPLQYSCLENPMERGA